MRMDPDLERSAADLVAEASEAELTSWFREYGEERYARAIARAIVARRAEAEIESTAELVEIVRGAVPQPALFAGGHPAKRVFQALRIAVNLELESLDAALEPAFELLEDGGRLAVISFHSLEDRRVKRFMRNAAREPEAYRGLPFIPEDQRPPFRLVGKARVANEEEVLANPRARSARLRIAERV
jgi:16S rRNA (cytosine1402-N4)-methyltransferase